MAGEIFCIIEAYRLNFIGLDVKRLCKALVFVLLCVESRNIFLRILRQAYSCFLSVSGTIFSFECVERLAHNLSTKRMWTRNKIGYH